MKDNKQYVALETIKANLRKLGKANEPELTEEVILILEKIEKKQKKIIKGEVKKE